MSPLNPRPAPRRASKAAPAMVFHPLASGMLTSRVAALAACTVAAPAFAQGDAPGFHPQPARLSLRVDAMAWYMGPGGDLDMPSTDALGDPEPFTIDALGYDSPRIVAAPEFHITWGDRWRVTLRGYYFSDEHNAVAGAAGQIGSVLFDAGTDLTSTYSFGSYEAEVGYKLFEFPGELAGVKDRDFFGTVEAVGGLRAFDLAWSVGRADAGDFPGDQRVSVDETFVQPYAGARLRLEFVQSMGLDAQVNVGMLPLGDGSNASGDVIVGGWWFPWPNVAVQIGYRAAYYSLGTGTGADSFDFTGWNQGLQFGVILTF